MTPEPFNILISSAGRRGALVDLCRRTLGEMNIAGKVLAADITRSSAAYQLADAGFYAGRFDDPAYIPDLLKVCKKQCVRLVIPTHDRELMLYARAYEQFEDIGCRVVIPSPRVVTLGSDKLATHDWLSAHHLPVPRQATPEEILANPSDWQMPLLIKPRFGSSSIGVHIVKDLDKLRLLTSEQPYLVQSIAKGYEYTVDLFVDESGSCRCAVPRRRIETRAGEISKGVTERNEVVIDLAKRVCGALPGARGVMNIQIFHESKTNECEIIELNTRFGGGYPLTHESGANYIRWLVEEARGESSTIDEASWQDGLVMLRYDDAVFISREQAGLDD